MPDQTPRACPVCKMAGDHKLSCPEREDGRLQFSTNLLPRTPSMPSLPKHMRALIGAYGFECRNGRNEVEITFHWQQLIAGIKDYAQAVADERVREALAELRDEIAEFDHKLVSWANAYPEDVFPKPDLAAVRAALEAAGLSLDCVSAHSMRHVASKLSESFGVVRALGRPTLSLDPSKGTGHG